LLGGAKMGDEEHAVKKIDARIEVRSCSGSFECWSSTANVPRHCRSLRPGSRRFAESAQQAGAAAPPSVVVKMRFVVSY
jgi:hypothetical protein